jgi:hypothetical protein
MSSRIVNLTNGHRYKFNQAKRLVEQQCACAWVQYGVTVRELTVDEMVKARSEQAKQIQLSQEVLGRNDLHSVRFEQPKTTTYQQPWHAYEEMEAPMGVRYCRWPRSVAA